MHSPRNMWKYLSISSFYSEYQELQQLEQNNKYLLNFMNRNPNTYLNNIKDTTIFLQLDMKIFLIKILLNNFVLFSFLLENITPNKISIVTNVIIFNIAARNMKNAVSRDLLSFSILRKLQFVYTRNKL